MHKKTKLLVLILMSLSVYFIYNYTKNYTYTIMNIGDRLSMGMNSYGVNDYGYIDYLADEYKKTKKEVDLNNKYSKKDQTIKNSLFLIKETPSIKKDLSNTNLLVINLGLNDLKFIISTEEELSESKYQKEIQLLLKNYDELIKEIKKYYHNNIIIVGYYTRNTNKYLEKGIKEINNYLYNNQDIYYIDITNLNDKSFSNPASYYPNRYGYNAISKKIIRKILANQ